MAKTTVSSWDQNADNNTDVAGINIAEGCPAAGINNAMRAIMAQIAALYTTLVQTGAGFVNTLAGAVLKQAGNASTVYDPSGAERFIGYRDLPVGSQATAAYTFALTDASIAKPITTGGTTIPANATVAFPVGTILIMHNNGSAVQQMAAATGVTLTLGGTTTTGTRNVPVNGTAYAWQRATNDWVISGTGVS